MMIIVLKVTVKKTFEKNIVARDLKLHSRKFLVNKN